MDRTPKVSSCCGSIICLFAVISIFYGVTLECQANPKAAAQQMGSTMVGGGLRIVPQAKEISLCLVVFQRNGDGDGRQGRFSVARAFRRPSSPMRVRPCICVHYIVLLAFLLYCRCCHAKPCVCVCVSETLKIRCLADKRPSWVCHLACVPL